MSRTQSMRSQHFFRTDSRKSRQALIVLALLLVSRFPVDAQQASVSASVGSRAVSVGVVLAHTGQVVLDALADGMRSQVTFEIRLYQPLSGLAGLLGDRLVAEYHPSFIAFRDAFTREYVIESQVGAQRRFQSADAFLAEFFVIRNFPIPTDGIADIEQHYLLCQVELRPVKLVPALRVLGALQPGDSIITPWTRVELSARGAAL